MRIKKSERPWALFLISLALFMVTAEYMNLEALSKLTPNERDNPAIVTAVTNRTSSPLLTIMGWVCIMFFLLAVGSVF